MQQWSQDLHHPAAFREQSALGARREVVDRTKRAHKTIDEQASLSVLGKTNRPDRGIEETPASSNRGFARFISVKGRSAIVLWPDSDEHVNA